MKFLLRFYLAFVYRIAILISRKEVLVKLKYDDILGFIQRSKGFWKFFMVFWVILHRPDWCLEHLDRLLCRKLKGRYRLWWSKLWIREDEFHPSLHSDVEYAYSLSKEEREEYFKDLMRRRDIAHRRDDPVYA